MDVDIRKPKIEQDYGILRQQNRIKSSSSGEDLDEEELLGDDFGRRYSSVHFSNDINPLEEDLDEQSPLLLPSSFAF